MSRCYVCGAEEESDEHLASGTMGTVWTLCRRCMAGVVIRVDAMRRRASSGNYAPARRKKDNQAAILAVLADGNAMPASEIVDEVNRGRAQYDRLPIQSVYKSCAHMVRGGLLVAEKLGRRTYYRRAAE